jgi:predicted nucleotidyltransferase
MAALAESAELGDKSSIYRCLRGISFDRSLDRTTQNAKLQNRYRQASMKPSLSMARHGSQVRQILDRFRMRNPRVFGSVARGADIEGSDLDILVEAPPGATLYDLAQAELELEQVLGCKVEVLTRASLAPDIAENVEADLTPIP